MTHRILLVAERFNLPRNAVWDGYVELNVQHWVRIALRAGVFRKGFSASKLKLIGVRWTDAMNLLPPAPQGERWDSRAARRVADEVVRLAAADRLHAGPTAMRKAPPSHVFICGRRAAESFGQPYAGWPMLHSTEVLWHPLVASKVMLIPHPSGLNRFWNDDVEIEVAREMVQEFLA